MNKKEEKKIKKNGNIINKVIESYNNIMLNFHGNIRGNGAAIKEISNLYSNKIGSKSYIDKAGLPGHSLFHTDPVRTDSLVLKSCDGLIAGSDFGWNLIESKEVLHLPDKDLYSNHTLIVIIMVLTMKTHRILIQETV